MFSRHAAADAHGRYNMMLMLPRRDVDFAIILDFAARYFTRADRRCCRRLMLDTLSLLMPRHCCHGAVVYVLRHTPCCRHAAAICLARAMPPLLAATPAILRCHDGRAHAALIAPCAPVLIAEIAFHGRS